MRIRVSAEGFDAFVRMLDGPPRDVPRLWELLRRPAPWENPRLALEDDYGAKLLRGERTVPKGVNLEMTPDDFGRRLLAQKGSIPEDVDIEIDES